MGENSAHDAYTAPAPIVTAQTIPLDGKDQSYRAECGWLTLHRHEKPAAEMFHTYYETEDPDRGNRPLTFVFNGGPGAASAYLHVGALGPVRVLFDETGAPLPPPVRLIDNTESWLAFTDLVFIDPIGTGFSRPIQESEPKPEGDGKKAEDPVAEASREYWKITRDLESLADFITSFLSAHHRWDSPVFIAGESYGGFRAAKLTRLLQETYGVGLNGALLISPALEFSLLDESDYDVLPWIDRIPSMALAAARHGVTAGGTPSGDPDHLQRTAETFATGELATLLIRGSTAPLTLRTKTLRRLARLVGVPTPVLEASGGRLSARRFARVLLADRGLVCGLYDATATVPDPFPGRSAYEGPDPTLRSIERVFAAGINAHVRHNLGVDTERRYHLLSMEVNKNWQVDIERHALESQIGATDDLRYAMVLNPAMKVRITHGLYDLVTPYFASSRIAGHLLLDGTRADNLSLVNYPGGHMFYAWQESRVRFASDTRQFYREALSSSR